MVMLAKALFRINNPNVNYEQCVPNPNFVPLGFLVPPLS